MRVVSPNIVDVPLHLDAKDRRIFRVLCENARTPASVIAKQVGLSGDAVNYRLAKYNECGLIAGYRTVIDLAAFGYENYHCFITIRKGTKDSIAKTIAQLQKLPFIRTIITYSGKYDMEIAFVAARAVAGNNYLRQILDTFSGGIIDCKLCVITDLYVSRFFPENRTAASQSVTQLRVEKIDAIDKSLLRELRDDARKPLYQIAQTIRTSADTVVYRLKKMQQKGYITSFVPSINYLMIGYTVYALFFRMLPLSQLYEMKIRSFLVSQKNVLWAVRALGDYNLLVYVVASSAADVHEFLAAFRQSFQDDMKDYELTIADEQWKFTYIPNILLAETEKVTLKR